MDYLYNNDMKRYFLLSLALGLSLSQLAIPLQTPSSAYAATAKDRERLNKLKTNESQIKVLGKKKKQVEVKIKESKSELAKIQQRLEQSANKLDASSRRYDEVHQEVEKVTDDLISAEDALEEQLDQAEQRLRRMYKTRQYAQANQLMESENLSTFIRRVGYYRYLARKDEALLQDLGDRKEKLSKIQYQQMLKRQSLGKEAQNLAEAKEQHSIDKKKQKSYLEKLTKERQLYEKEMRALERESRSITSMLQQRYARQSRTSFNLSLGTGRFTNPIQGYPMTSRFGYRIHPIFRTSKLHTGVDFGAPSGTHIRAADSGVVISAGWQGGYGKAVIVDHGKGLVTLYAHTSAFYVRPGQSVKKGQVIAAIGTTGYSTGPHLHMEVRQNGVPVDPLRWF